jgi:hypothetical protein
MDDIHTTQTTQQTTTTQNVQDQKELSYVYV